MTEESDSDTTSKLPWGVNFTAMAAQNRPRRISIHNTDGKQPIGEGPVHQPSTPIHDDRGHAGGEEPSRGR